MTTATITVQVDADAAKIYESTGQQDQAKLRLLFSVLLREYAGSARTLDAIMDDIGARAAALGMTEEKLQAMLDAR